LSLRNTLHLLETSEKSPFQIRKPAQPNNLVRDRGPWDALIRVNSKEARKEKKQARGYFGQEVNKY